MFGNRTSKNTELYKRIYLCNVKQEYKIRNRWNESDAKGNKGRDWFRQNLITGAPDLYHTS
jgi:hypothetical protein